MTATTPPSAHWLEKAKQIVTDWDCEGFAVNTEVGLSILTGLIATALASQQEAHEIEEGDITEQELLEVEVSHLKERLAALTAENEEMKERVAHCEKWMDLGNAGELMRQHEALTAENEALKKEVRDLKQWREHHEAMSRERGKALLSEIAKTEALTDKLAIAVDALKNIGNYAHCGASGWECEKLATETLANLQGAEQSTGEKK